MTKPITLSAEEFRKLAGVPVKARKEDELDGASEKQVMAEIITALEAKGYRRPSHWEPGTRGIYMRVGQHRADFGGSDKGVPDLIVIRFRPATLNGERATWRDDFLIEVKARTKAARPSKEQNTLAQLGVIHIVNSAGQVLALLENA